MSALPVARVDVEHVVIDGEAVIYDARGEAIHHLNATATVVWQCCDGAGTLEELVDDLAASYHAPRPEIDTDVRALLTDLAARGLLVGTEPEVAETVDDGQPIVVDEPPNP